MKYAVHICSGAMVLSRFRGVTIDWMWIGEWIY
jgi:hypothetical protein